MHLRTHSRWVRRAIPRISLTTVLVALAMGAAIALRPPPPDVRVLCSNNDASCAAVTAEYERRSGISVEVVRMPTTQALYRLLEPGRSAEFDVWMGGPNDAYAVADEAGLLAPSPVAWAPVRWLPIYGGILALCVREEVQLDSWAELPTSGLRIAVPHPITSGTAATFLAFQNELLGARATDYLRRLDAATTTYTDSGVAPAALVATGRVDVGITFAPYCEREITNGAPLRVVYPKEGTSYEVGAIAVLRDAPNLAAAHRFVQFAASSDGQEIGAAAAQQAPISPQLSGDLAEQLEALEVPVVHLDPRATGVQRDEFIAAWLREVRHGRL